MIEVIEFTDPVCTWCWGAEPVLRALQLRYGDQLTVRSVMGGLVDDIRTFYDAGNDIGGDPDAANASIVSHWVTASERHGMPVQSDGFALFSAEYPSTFPQNIAVKAAQQQSAVLAERFLRRIREATAAEARVTSKIEVLLELASEVGLDVGELLVAIEDGSAADAFEADRKLIALYGSRGFPAFLIRYQDKEMLLRGYQQLPTFIKMIGLLTDGKIQPKSVVASEAAVVAFIGEWGRVAPVEISMAFGLGDAETREILDRLIQAGRVVARPVGNGTFIEAPGGFACDPVTGVCR